MDESRTIRWVTIAVTPLPPGWRNVFFSADGTPDAHPCPAVLLQENRSAGPPYETRVVFAERDGACLYPVDEPGDFAGIIHPGQSPEDCDGT
jgi:hypothetical protein